MILNASKDRLSNQAAMHPGFRIQGIGSRRILPTILALLHKLSATHGGSVPSVRLNNGIEMPILSFGANMWDAPTCSKATSDALSVGFRNIWSSELVGESCQRAQAMAIKASGLARSDLFLAGTVDTNSCSGTENCYDLTKRQSEKQLEVLGEDVLDMLMLDYPPSSSGCDGIRGQWQAFEEFYVSKRVRTIAVSNFYENQLQCILANTSATVPAVNQMYLAVGRDADIVADNAKHGINLQAYTPLASGRLSRDKLCKEIGTAHGKSAAQVALRWIIQHNATICAQSSKLEHLRELSAIFDFSLSDDEMSRLDAVSGSRSPEL